MMILAAPEAAPAAEMTLGAPEAASAAETAGANIAAGAGILAAFSRFIEKWDAIITFLLLIAISVITVLTFQGIEYTSNPYYTLIKWVGVFGFLGFNVSVILQLLRNGLEPALNRRDERSATKDN